jgi:hypothetical protein
MDERLNHLPERWLNEPEALVVALRLDMTHYWQRTAEGYFERVSKGLILEAVREGSGPGAAAKIDGRKKDAMAKRAEALLAGKGWLPTLLRWRLRLAPARKAGASSNALRSRFLRSFGQAEIARRARPSVSLRCIASV